MNADKNTAPAKGLVPAEAPSAPQKANHSERFAAKVMQEFGSAVGPLEVNEYMRSLIQGYFIGIDSALKLAEEARLRKRKDQDPVPVTWEYVNLAELALDVMHYAKVGLDMSMDNHLFAIPYKNNKTGLYDVTLMQGYNGIQYIAEKYALEIPLRVTVELVFTSDIFIPYKKSRDNAEEGYRFEIQNPFDRGEVSGGFGYIEYSDPSKNKLIIMTRKDIEKRKPKYAAPEFWGGTKPKWANGQKVGEEQVEGWIEEMCLKTVKREVYGSKHIPRDPQKIDENYRYLKRRDAEAIEAAQRAAIDGYPDAGIIDITPPAPPYALPEGNIDHSTGELLSSGGSTQPSQPVEAGGTQQGMNF